MRHVVPQDADCAAAHCGNQVVNSRYTKWTFIPFNLAEQFGRPLNLYFLLVALLQFFPAIAPVNPMSTLLPLLFAFTLTAAKEGYDDYRRHCEDDEYNRRPRSVLRNGRWVSVRSESIFVGDIVRVRADEDVPCDLVAVAAPRECDGVIHIRTENLDGEMDLKAREIAVIQESGRSGEEQGPSSRGLPLDVQRFDGELALLEQLLHEVIIVCPPPSALVSSFDARVEMRSRAGEAAFSLSALHLLPQSSLLKNTSEIVGVAVYTGNETKCGMNKRGPPLKWARLDQGVSQYAKLIFACQLTVAAIFGIVGFAINKQLPDRFWYLRASETSQAASAFMIFPLRFFLLTSVMIPISFKFVVDMSKFFVAMILRWDLQMYDDERGVGVRVKNSSIVEDLGQVEYVLTDKTGTMTENSMRFVGCSVGGRKYMCEEPAASSRAVEGIDDAHPALGGEGGVRWDAMLTAMCICNTVQTANGADGSARQLVTMSPDEEALCRGAEQFGVALWERTRNRITVRVHESQADRFYSIEHVFPFSSEKKCMSIVVREHATNSFKLLCKGADDKVVSLLSDPHDARDVLQCREHLLEFASRGLRTLVFAEKALTSRDMEALKHDIDHASMALERRAEALDAVRDRFEAGLQLIGASAIEDKLQEGIVDVLRDMQLANVRVWMLTGDKIETAQQIALSCGLMSTTDERIHVHGELWREVLRTTKVPAAARGPGTTALVHRSGAPRRAPITSVNRFRSANYSGRVFDENESNGSAGSDEPFVSFIGAARPTAQVEASLPEDNNNDLVVDYDGTSGTVGGSVAANDALEAAFRSIGPETVLVVEGGAVLDAILDDAHLTAHFTEVAMACKSVICARVTPGQKAAVTELVTGSNHLTLAVGDGGNDVAMIQAAHVGVGIVGREGQQAARAADFAIAKFRFLAPLMFVHGHMSYRRTCYVVQYSFYKSMLISFIQLVYNASCTMFSGVSFWDSFGLTLWNGIYTLPPILLFCLDRCAPRIALEKNPALYRLSQHGYGQTPLSFFGFILRGILQSVAGLWLVMSIFDENFVSSNSGTTASVEMNFTITYSSFVLLQFFTVIIESSSITAINATVIILMPLCYVLLTSVYSSIPRFAYFGVFSQTVTSAHVVACMLMVAVLFLPHLGFEAARQAAWPNMIDVARRLTVQQLQRTMRESIASPRLLRRTPLVAGLLATAKLGFKRMLWSIVTVEGESVSNTGGSSSTPVEPGRRSDNFV